MSTHKDAKTKIKASLWKHPRLFEILGKEIGDEIQEKKDRLDRLEMYHTALQSIKATTDFYKANNLSYASATRKGTKTISFDIFGSWNFMNDIDESDLIVATRDLKNKIVDKFSEDVI